MKKNEFINTLSLQLQEFTGGKLFINISQLSKALGVARETTAQMVYTLKYIPNGREKLFYISDVATHLYKQLQSDGTGGMLID